MIKTIYPTSQIKDKKTQYMSTRKQTNNGYNEMQNTHYILRSSYKYGFHNNMTISNMQNMQSLYKLKVHELIIEFRICSILDNQIRTGVLEECR